MFNSLLTSFSFANFLSTSKLISSKNTRFYLVVLLIDEGLGIHETLCTYWLVLASFGCRAKMRQHQARVSTLSRLFKDKRPCEATFDSQSTLCDEETRRHRTRCVDIMPNHHPPSSISRYGSVLLLMFVCCG